MLCWQCCQTVKTKGGGIFPSHQFRLPKIQNHFFKGKIPFCCVFQQEYFYVQKARRAFFLASGFFGPAIFGLIFGLSGSGLGPNPPLIAAIG